MRKIVGRCLGASCLLDFESGHLGLRPDNVEINLTMIRKGQQLGTVRKSKISDWK